MASSPAFSLRRQMILALGLAGVFPLLLAGILVSPLARDTAEQRALEAQRDEARGLADGLGLWLDEALRNTEVVAGAPEFAQVERRDDDALAARLAPWDGRICAAAIWGLDGKLLAAVGEQRGPPPLPAYQQSPRARIDGLRQLADRWVVPISVPIPQHEGPGAVLSCSWDASPLLRTAARVAHDSTRVGLLHADGRMIGVLPRLEVQRANAEVVKAYDTRSATSLCTPLLHGEEELQLTALQPMQGLDASTFSATVPFVLSLARPREEARDAAARLEHAILFSGLGVTLVLCLTASILARLIGSPLQQLTRRVEGFAVRMASRRDRTEPPRSDNELQRLHDSFEQMADRVEEHQEALFERNVEMQATLERLRATDQVKDEFLSFLSHEMRTPLTAIRSFAELLRTTPQVSPEEQEEFLSIIESECERLETLSQDLLDLARIQLGEMRWRDQLLDPGEMVESVVRTLSVLAARGGAHLLAQSRPDLPAIHADPDKLRQVLTNLVANALRFTPEGGQVTVRALECEGEEGRLCIQVMDTGPGIPDELLEEVFNPFVQAHATEADTPRGSGLGLAICQRIVEHYDGSIRAYNGVNGGAILELSLPVADPVPVSF